MSFLKNLSRPSSPAKETRVTLDGIQFHQRNLPFNRVNQPVSDKLKTVPDHTSGFTDRLI